MGVEITGLDEIIKMVVDSPDKIYRKNLQKAQNWASKLAGLAREGCPVDTGQTRNSIESYVKSDSQAMTIEGGAKSSNPVAGYLEFGTGPVGASSNHPMAEELGITYRPDGWVFQSERVAQFRGEPYVKNETGGYAYTEGRPATAMFYNAMKALEDDIVADLGATITEVLE